MRLATGIMKHPSVKMHGPEHHFLATGSTQLSTDGWCQSNLNKQCLLEDCQYYPGQGDWPGIGHILAWYGAIEIESEPELLGVIHLPPGEVKSHINFQFHWTAPKGKDKQVQAAILVEAVERIPVQ